MQHHVFINNVLGTPCNRSYCFIFLNKELKKRAPPKFLTYVVDSILHCSQHGCFNAFVYAI